MIEKQKTSMSHQTSNLSQLTLKILLVERNWPDQRLISKMLESQGCIVTAVNNLQEAGHLLENKTVDMVLMDTNIFKSNGFDIKTVIQNSERKSGKRIPMIALSGHFMKDHRDHQMESGMDEYLPKPVFEEELCRVILKVAGQIEYDTIPIIDSNKRNVDETTVS